MAMTIGEAQALNNLLNYFLNGGKRFHGADLVSHGEAQRACAVLAKAANKTLMAGYSEQAAFDAFTDWKARRDNQ